MKPSDPAGSGQTEVPGLFRLRLFKYFYISLSFVCLIWFFMEFRWESAALTLLGFLGLGALGPQFARLPQGAMPDFEIGAAAGRLIEPSVSQSWLATLGESIVGSLGLAFQALLHAMIEGFFYLLVAGVIFAFRFVAGLV